MLPGDASLPGTPPPTLGALWEALSGDVKAAALPHLLGDSSADWLARTFTKAGHPISASTIRTYRRSLA